MKIFPVLIAIIALTLSTLTVSPAQAPATTLVIDTTAATTAWDSVYIGPLTWTKYVKVINQNPTGILLIALENDTSAGKILYLRNGQTKLFLFGIGDKRFIRTKSSTGTMLRYVESEY
jgi:hypothetical protein